MFVGISCSAVVLSLTARPSFSNHPLVDWPRNTLPCRCEPALSSDIKEPLAARAGVLLLSFAFFLVTSHTAITTSANTPIEPIEIPAMAPGLRLLLSRVDGGLEIVPGGGVAEAVAFAIEVNVSPPNVLETDTCVTVDVRVTNDVCNEIVAAGDDEDNAEAPPVIWKCEDTS